ncbi:MAG: ATP-grasp domain-containing protein [Clostridiales bacterium]|nr:ATP-grasp domain-containing protein [Clostridiales bacterium]
MKKIMILGAGRGQVDLIKSVKKYGHYAIVASIKGNYPGFDYADECCYVDISDPEAVLKEAKKLKIDAITTACLDTGVASLGYVCEEMGLCGLSQKAAEISGNKLLMKDAFMRNNVNTARYKKISSASELVNITDELRLPLIVKAVDLQGSRGINIVRDKEDLIPCFEDTMRETNQDYCIIEEFIPGIKFGTEAFVFDNNTIFILPYGDVVFRGKTNIPIGHYVPYGLDEKLISKVKTEAKKAIKALNLNNCAVDVDMILYNDEVYIIELTGRVGANCLPQLSSIYYGIDVYRLIIETALGDDPTEYFVSEKKHPTPCYAKMLYSEKSGVLKEIINNNRDDENIYEISYFVKPGDEVRKFTNSRDCIGQIVVKGNTLEECKTRIDSVIDNIEFGIT